MAAKILVTLFALSLCFVTIYIVKWLMNPQLFSQPIFNRGIPDGYTLMRPEHFYKEIVRTMLIVSCLSYVLAGASCWMDYLPNFRGDPSQFFIPAMIGIIGGLATSLLSSIYFYLAVANKFLYNNKEIKRYLPFHKKPIVLLWDEITSAEYHCRDGSVVLKSAKQNIAVGVLFSNFSGLIKLVKAKVKNYSEI